MKTGYDILKGLCKVRNEVGSYMPLENPITNRVNYIMNTLKEMGVIYSLDMFNPYTDNKKYLNRKYVNIGVEIMASEPTEETVMFTAHHDVNNPVGDNCQDNSASVANLIDLIGRLKNKELDKNVIVVFTDCEEFGGKGANRLSKRINDGEYGNVNYVVNLELTANGTNIWADVKDEEKTPLLIKVKKTLELEDRRLTLVRTPFNDSVIFKLNEIDSVCFGSFTDEDMNEVKERGYCKTWALCHKGEKDSFDNASKENMSKFVDFLIKLI